MRTIIWRFFLFFQSHWIWRKNMKLLSILTLKSLHEILLYRFCHKTQRPKTVDQHFQLRKLLVFWNLISKHNCEPFRLLSKNLKKKKLFNLFPVLKTKINCKISYLRKCKLNHRKNFHSSWTSLRCQIILCKPIDRSWIVLG